MHIYDDFESNFLIIRIRNQEILRNEGKKGDFISDSNKNINNRMMNFQKNNLS
jgi:hypothetical protein